MDGLIFVGSPVHRKRAGGQRVHPPGSAAGFPLCCWAALWRRAESLRYQCDERAAMRSAAARLMDSGCEASSSFTTRCPFLPETSWPAIGRDANCAASPPRQATRCCWICIGSTWCRRVICCCAAGKRAALDAVLAADDRLAVGAAKFAKRQGLRVPEDLQIIGCNNSPIARYCDPE